MATAFSFSNVGGWERLRGQMRLSEGYSFFLSGQGFSLGRLVLRRWRERERGATYIHIILLTFRALVDVHACCIVHREQTYITSPHANGYIAQYYPWLVIYTKF
jgi:hypothetical protein